jgi:glycosyltransferase involved in cell wall biosynthesis
MRIALTADPELPVPPTHYGGIERIVDMLASGLSRRGHVVTLFAHASSTNGAPLVPWPGRRSQSATDTALNAAVLAREIARDRFDVIHSFSRIAYLTLVLPLSIPKLMTYQRAISPRSVWLGHRLSRSTLEFSAISRAMMQPVHGMGRWHMVPNGVSLATYSFRGEIPADAPLVFLGRVEEIKGPHLAIEIARRAGMRLVIAGNIPDEHRAWADAHVLKHVDGLSVDYVGPVDDIQKNALLGKSRALLMPILWDEPFGIVMIEAMACGTPVLAFNRGAVPEVVEDGVTGFVRADVQELAAAANRLDEIDRMACRARVEKLYSSDRIVETYLGIYRSMSDLGTAASWAA